MATVTFFDLLGVSEESSPRDAAVALWPLGFIQATTGVSQPADPGELPLLVDMLQSACTFRAVRPGAGPDGVSMTAELLVGTTAAPLVLSAFPDVEIQPLHTSGGPARVYAHKRDTGTEIIVESLPVEIRLPRRLLMPLEDPGQPIPDEKTVLTGFVAGQHDTVEVILKRDAPSLVRVHVKVRMTEERNFVLETAVPISIGECRFNNFPCRAIHDLSFVPTPILSEPHDPGEQPLEWTRHPLEVLSTLGATAGGVLTARTIDLHDERPPLAELADKPNEDRDEEEHVEIVLEDLALPVMSPGYPIPTHFLIGLRRKLELGDDPFGAYNLEGLPVKVRISGFSRILADWLIVEQLLIRSIDWRHIDDGTAESQFIFMKLILSDDEQARGSSATITISDEWTVELGWRHSPGVELFKIFGAQFTLLGLRAGASIMRLVDGRSIGDSLLAVGDLELQLVGKGERIVNLESASEKPTTRVIHDFGWRLGSVSLGRFWDPNGAKLSACDVLRFDVDEFGFTTEPSGGRYIAFSGTIPIGGGPDDKPATDAASTTTDDKAQNGVAFRFYRVRAKISGPEEAPDTLIDGIGLSVRFDRLKLSAFGSLSERLEEDGHRYREIGLGLQLRLGAAGAELIVGGSLFYGHVTGPQHNFTYWLASVQVSPIPIGSVQLKNVRLMGAQNMAPNLGPADVGAAQPMRMFDWYTSHADSLELSPSRNLTSNGWLPLDDAFAVGAGLALTLAGSSAVTFDVFALYGKTPSGSNFLAVLKVFAFGSKKPVAFGAFEMEPDRWSLMIGLAIGPKNVIGKEIPLLESTPILTGLIYATNKPSTVAIGHINDTSSWLALHVKGDLWVFKFELFAGVCLEIVDSPDGPRVFGLRVSVTGGTRFLGIGGMDFYLTLQFTAGVWRTESKVSGFVAILEGGAHFDVFFVFDFGASFKVQWDYLGPDPTYRRIYTEVKIHTPWWLPDVTFRWNKVISQPALERMQLIATPIIESSAHALAKKAADALPVTPLVGSEIVEDEVHRMSDVAPLGDASFPPGALDDLLPVAVDSVIAVNFKAAVDNRLVWGQNTPTGMGTQASGQVSTQYELVELGIRRRAHTGPDAGVWTTLVEATHSRAESLNGLTPAEIAERLVPIVSLLWDGDFQREDKLDPRRLLVNAEVPYLTAELNFEADEALVRGDDGWPCCKRRRKPRWHTLDYLDVPFGERAPATKEFTDSHSTLHWVGAPPPVVGPGLLLPTPEPVARVSPSAPPQTPFARMSFDEPASVVDIVLLWRAMHLPRKLVLTPFRGLEALPERTFPLSSPNLTRILLNEPDGITHVLMRFEGPAVQAAAAAAATVDWLELSRVRYRARAEVLDDLLDGLRCNRTNEDAASGGKRFAWMANHDYELSLRTRVTIKDEQSSSLIKELHQKLSFVTKGLPGLNAIARIGEELEPYVESRYASADLPLYRAEPIVLAFNERFDIFAALERPPSPTDPPERKQAYDVVLAIEKIGGSGTERRISQSAPDWIVTHRSIPHPLVKHPPYVVGGSVLDPIVREGVREAISLDPLRVRFDAVLVSPSGCGLPEPPARRSRTLSHDAVDPDAPDVTPRRWPAQTVLRASVRRKEAPFVERTPFAPGDEGALTRVGGAAWTVTDGAVGPDPSAASRQLAVFGESSWEHLTARAAVDAQNVEAGIAVAVGGFPLGSRALLAVVDPSAQRLRMLARHAGADVELASADLTVEGPVALEITAYDDEVRAQVGEVTVSAPRGDLRSGRLALVARGGARFQALRVDGLELYRFELTTSRYADLVEHVGSFGGEAVVFVPSGNQTATIADLLAADPGLLTGEPVDKLARQARFDRWASALALPLRRRVERLELSRRLDDDRTDLILLESPEPLPLGEDVSLAVVRVADPFVVLTPVISLANGDRTAAIVVPIGFAGIPVTLQKATYRMRFSIDRPRYRGSDAASRFQQEATLEVDL